MDFLKKAATDFAVKSALESSESKTATNAAAPEGNEQKPKQEQDYGDKGLSLSLALSLTSSLYYYEVRY